MKGTRMNQLLKRAIPSVCILSCVAVVAAIGQQSIRARVQSEKDRSAAPSFRLANASGKLVRLSDLRGKPVVLNLWATDCGGCRAELPAFMQMDQRYKGKGLAVVGVSLDIMYSDLKNSTEGWARVKLFVKTKGIEYSILLDDGSVEKAFNVTALPATYLIDRAGRVAAIYVGVVDPSDLEANIKILLSER